MARGRTKARTKPSAKVQNGATQGKPMDRSPKSMVIRMGAGEVGASVSQLVKDMRLVMEPGTAVRLRERKSNKLKDYVTMAGPLGVTHLLLFSRSTSGNTNLRIAISPHGPTLHFRVENYSLCKDVLKAQRHPKGSSLLYLNPPLLVMNNFTTAQAATDTASTKTESPQLPRELESTVTTIFQSLFPPLSPQSMPLASIKRVLMLNREPQSDSSNGVYTINLRHYAISSKVTGLPKPIRRLTAAEKVKRNDRRGKGVPNLGQLGDVAEYLLDPTAGNYTSGSESEPETDAEVEVLAPATKKIYHKLKQEKKRAANGENVGPVLTEDRRGVEKHAIKLSELGPRMKLRLVKIEAGLAEGEIMWHEYIKKTKEEETNLKQVWETRKKEKAERKRIQKENVAKKRKEKTARGGKKDQNEDEDEEMEDYEDWDSDDIDDVQDV